MAPWLTNPSHAIDDGLFDLQGQLQAFELGLQAVFPRFKGLDFFFRRLLSSSFWRPKERNRSVFTSGSN